MKKAKERVKNLDEIGKVERGDEKRASDAEARQAKYLKTQIDNITKAKKNDEGFLKKFEDAADYNQQSPMDKDFDEYVESKVKKKKKK